MKKLKVIETAPTFFAVMGLCIQKTMITKIRLVCGVFSTIKTSGTAYIEFGNLFNNQKHNHPKSFVGGRKKNKI